MPRSRTRSRREFLIESGITIAGASMAACLPDVGGKWPVERAECASAATTAVDPTVFEVHNPAGLLIAPDGRSATVEAEVAATMVRDAIAGLTGDGGDPWSVLLPDFAAEWKIGIKVNCLNPSCPTSVPVVRALVDSLVTGLRISRERIIVWDRRLDELTTCGFTEESVGAIVLGTVNSTDDPSGPGYEEEYCSVLGTPTHLSRILTERTDVTINCPVLKTHNISGITGAMKNVYGVIDNPEDFHDNLVEALPVIYNLAPIRDRTRLILLDALIAVTLGDTSSQADTFPARIIAGRDPVALDTFAYDLVNQQRAIRDAELPDATINPIGAEITAWLENAELAGLGTRAFQLTTLAP